ncbi:Multidrug resistance-associated protein 1 [Phytophthora cactorum]|nr:Multidrug resistance-associated protein 1 [Phytophthora cactorum]
MSKLSADDNYLPAKTSTAAESWSREGSFEEDKGDLHDKENPLNTARFLSIATMWWMHPLLKRGYKTPLDENSVWDLPTDDQARPLQVKFDQSYALESQKVAGKTKRNGAPKRPNVNRAIWESVKQTWGIAFVLHVVSAGLILFQPFLIKAILQNINGEDNSLGISSGYTLAVLLGCTAFVGATTMSAGQFLTTRIACNARMICINSAFRKILRLSAIARRTMDTGEIVTFVGVDSDRVLSAYKLGMWCTISPLMLLVVGVLIGTQMHVIVALVASVAIAIILYASLFMSKMIGAYRRQISRISANRLKVTNEMLQGIRVVKFYRWEGFATDLIGEIRAREIALLRKYNYVRLANTVLTFLAPTLLSLVCFATTVLLGNTLDIPTTFAIVALTNACRTPFSVYADASVAVAEAVTSTSRLSDFLAAGETTDNIQQSEDLTLEIPPQISIENADFKWEEDASAPTLANINVSLQPGTLTVVVGPVGSGKSSLVNAILGEMPQTRGKRLVRGNIAYASQQAWIQNQTVRENILFGEPHEAEHYQRVVSACQLAPDFKMLEHGDQTEIGERGINLSGGQKARIAVARAMYRARNFDFVVLDDPLSALDVHVANAVFSDGLMGIASETTRLLVLNSHYHLLQHADRVLVMSGGQIDGDGTLMELQDKFSFLRCSPRSRRSSVEDPAKYEVPGAVEDDEKSTQAKLIVANNDAVKASSSGKLTTLEDRLVGSVKLQSYTDYLACSEWDARVLCGLMIALFTIAQVVLFGCDWFLSLWSQGSVDLSQLNSLAVYVGIVVAAAILSLGRCIFFMTICMVCSLKIHFKHLKKVMAAPITTFFDITPIGRILNRFSRDLDEVDNPLPYWGLWLALCIFQVASSFIVCAVVNPFVLIVYVPVGYGCWFAAKVYRASARELKRLDGVSRSPFLNLMSETISGIETVRSYKMVDAFASRCEELLNKNIRVFFLAQVSSRWFDMRSDWLVSVIIGAVAILAVAAKSTVGASVAGLGLTYAAQLSSNFQRMTTLATKVESSMTCFERIAHYGSLDEEGFKRTPSNKDALSPAWPKTGNVVFENVSMRYREDLPLVLKGVSFSVTSGEKVGICGRTGSGKSSLMSVLFRVVEIPTAGRVLIDGVDISTITVHQLRTKLTIIPQDPMLFSGSLRMNLDPFAEKSDAELWEVLRKVHLADTVSSWGKGLDYEVAEKGENLSVGQRQLLCIARALIRDSKVIVMDEATANVDQESDKLIQQTMKESFGDGNNTVLCIAHRIETIMDSDKILVLDAGEVAEFDSPSALLQIKAGIFKSLVGSGKITLS